MDSEIFDCRSYEIKSYACDILKKRAQRFSTVYACCFVTSSEAASALDDAPSQADGRPQTDLLVSANSTGELSLYLLSDLVQRWTAGQQSAAACCSWTAHSGPVYCLAKAQAGSEVVILTGGDDGYVRGWRLSDVLLRLRAQQQQKQQQRESLSQAPDQGEMRLGGADLAPCLAVRLPRVESPLAAISLPPAVQALALAGAGSGAEGPNTLFVGCSDGGVHSVDLASGAVRQPQPSPASAAAAGAGGVHAAAVLTADYHGPSNCLATGSEDGTVRLWDTRGGATCCSRTWDVAAGREVGGGAEALRCLRNPHIACLRFEPSGSWLMVGQGGGGGGGAGGSISMWSLAMGQKARQVATSFVPQAMAVQPAEVLVAGSEPALSRFSMALEGPSQQPLATRSVFGLDVQPDSGAVAVGGCGASLELLSKYGKKTGGVYFTSDED